MVSWRGLARGRNAKENGDEAMGSVAGRIHRGVPGSGTERADGIVHGGAAGTMRTVAEEAPSPLWQRNAVPRVGCWGLATTECPHHHLLQRVACAAALADLR